MGGAKPTVIGVWQCPSPMVSGPPHCHIAAFQANLPSQPREGTL